MIKFIMYVVAAIISGIILSIFWNTEIEDVPQAVVNALALIALWDICKHTEKNEREV